MQGSLFKDIRVAKIETLVKLANDPLKLNNAGNTCLINLYIVLFYFKLFLTIKYLCIFKISNQEIALTRTTISFLKLHISQKFVLSDYIFQSAGGLSYKAFTAV